MVFSDIVSNEEMIKKSVINGIATYLELIIDNNLAYIR